MTLASAFKTDEGQGSGPLAFYSWPKWYPMTTPGSKGGWEIEFCAFIVYMAEARKEKRNNTGFGVNQLLLHLRQLSN